MRRRGVPMARGPRRSARIALALLGLLGSAALRAQSSFEPSLHLRPFVELRLPWGDDQANYAAGFGAGTALEYHVLPFLSPFVRGEYESNPLKTTTSASLALSEGDLGLGFSLKAGDSLAFRLDAMGGAANASYLDKSGNAYTAGFRLGASLRVAPAWTLAAEAGMSRYYGRDAPFLTVGTAGLVASFDLSAIGGRPSRLRIEGSRLEPVFPSLYAYYDDTPFGSVRLVNGEDGAVRNVTVSFNAGRYMDQPKVCAQYAVIPSGGEVTVPLTALFTDQVLEVTQDIDAKGEVIVEYSFFGQKSEARFPVDFLMHFRNAITWTNDRRAAAFVSATNPASLWFAKFAAGIVRDRLRSGIDRNMQYAMGLFEAERLYGLNYVVVPANDYSVRHADPSIVDSVQFPQQTLQNRGGDCSDLSILYASILQSLGIQAAFITIPGHIFAAFDLGIPEKEARATLFDPGLAIYRDGKAWAPVEITMVRDDFMKAWKVGAKEWYDNDAAGKANFYTLPDCWKVYPSASFPDVNPRFALPDQAEMMRDFDDALDHYVVQQIDPQVRRLKERLAGGDPNELANELGILYGRSGMLQDAWDQFSSAAKDGYQSAWDNLGNVAFLRKDFALALSYYQYAEKLEPKDNIALLGVSRCQYELERYDSADASYARLKSRDLGVAVKYAYLGSVFDETGRAWSLAERQASTVWARPPAPAVAVAPPKAAATVTPTPAVPVAPVPAATVPAAPVAPTPAVTQPAAVAAAPATSAAPVPVTPVAPVAAAPAAAATVITPSPAPVETVPAAPSSAAAETPTAVATAPAVALAPAAAAEPPAATAAQAAAPTPAAAVEPPLPPALAALPADADIVAAAAAAAAAKAATASAATEAAATAPAGAPARAKVTATTTSPAPAVASAPVAAPPALAALPADGDIAAAAAAAAAAKTAAATAPKAAPAATTAEAATEAALAATAAAVASAPATTVTAAAAAPATAVVSPAPVLARPIIAMIPPPAPEPAMPPALLLPEPAATSPTSTAAPGPATPAAAAEAPQASTPSNALPEPDLPAGLAVATPVAAPIAAVAALPETGTPVPPVLEGFEGAFTGRGVWKVAKDTAEQTDPKEYYAKLVAPLGQGARPYRYEFSARSEGSGLVGFGLHVFVRSATTHEGWGEGRSILVWLTYDKHRYGSEPTRLQIYRSLGNSYMEMIRDLPLSISIFTSHAYSVEVDPDRGDLSVAIDGQTALSETGIGGLGTGDFVVFRTIDRAAFSDFRVEVGK